VAHLFSHGSRSELEQDFKAFGAPPPEMLRAIEQADTFEVWPENWEPLEIFMRLQTQWRVSPTGTLLGLEYAGVRAALCMMGATVTPELFDDLQTMETSALSVFRKGAEA